jgi:ribosomal protein S17E
MTIEEVFQRYRSNSENDAADNAELGDEFVQAACEVTDDEVAAYVTKLVEAVIQDHPIQRAAQLGAEQLMPKLINYFADLGSRQIESNPKVRLACACISKMKESPIVIDKVSTILCKLMEVVNG